MALSLPTPTSGFPARLTRRYLRAPAPLYFPEEEKVPESIEHRERVRVLELSVRCELEGRATIRADHFLYWDPTNPRRCLAPDLAVRLGPPLPRRPAWKTWEVGAPHLGVEIVSDWDRSQGRFEVKLERYRQAGILEVVRFDSEDASHVVRVWDLLDGDLVERDPADPDSLRSDVLGFYFRVVEDPALGPTLRLTRDPAGKDLVLTDFERAEAARQAAVAEKEAAVAEKEAAVAEKEAAVAQARTAVADKEAALARLAALEAELTRRR
jgi:Uma2 family endonuclease